MGTVPRSTSAMGRIEGTPIRFGGNGDDAEDRGGLRVVGDDGTMECGGEHCGCVPVLKKLLNVAVEERDLLVEKTIKYRARLVEMEMAIERLRREKWEGKREE